MSFSNKVYDRLKWIAMYLLPALGTLYFALAKLWSLPYGTEIVGTITALDTFLAALLGISKHSYQGEGTIQLSEDDDTSEVELYGDIQEMIDRGRITLNVERRGEDNGDY